jgi:hypothetical protein
MFPPGRMFANVFAFLDGRRADLRWANFLRQIIALSRIIDRQLICSRRRRRLVDQRQIIRVIRNLPCRELAAATIAGMGHRRTIRRARVNDTAVG